ncbi:MAG: PilZ domain-containing protein [Desulfomonilia bacterium]
MKNRRRDRRTRLPDKVGATIAYSDALTHLTGGYVCNISSHGMFMEADTVLDKDSYLSLKLNSENLIGKSIWVQGLVVRTEPGGMGIRFTHASDDDLSGLLTY